MNNLKSRLDALVEQYNTPSFIENDPVQFPRAFTRQEDVEIAAFLASTIALGNRKQILTGCRKMFQDIMQNRPFEYVMSGRFNEIDPTPIRHKGGSACKRLNLMLRWLCRQDGVVDMGIWQKVKPSQLMIPLDTHVARIGREMGLISRNGNDRATVEELTAKLRELDANDPCKYDFALFGLSESQKRMKP